MPKPAVEVVRSIFFNSANPATDPDAYLQCIEKLYKAFKTIYAPGKTKLVVNTCGWVEGLGAKLISDIASWFNAMPATLFITMSSGKQSEVEIASQNKVVVKGDLAQ